MWLTLLLLAPPIGVVFGYAMTAILIAYFSWEYVFYVQAIMIAPCVIAFLVTPSKYFDIEQALENKRHIKNMNHRDLYTRGVSQTGGTTDHNRERYLSAHKRQKTKVDSIDRDGLGLSAVSSYYLINTGCYRNSSQEK